METAQSNQRLGLGLSGGGFRASFYHIGVLARMAELGMLKHVESISTVSGGSIVGAAYYLLVKGLLENKSDADITDQDYVGLVERLEAHFLDAIQKNLRMRTFADPVKNLRMSKANYSRSDTIGELYEKYIYKPLLNVGEGPIHMTDLLITPKGIEGKFHPGDESIGNHTRVNKVPVLILNATSLNSGHNWIFTASSMGEVPPRNPNFRDIDKKDRYRRVRYDEIKTRRPNFRLGSAVAASAGVPGLFPPMAVSDLYKERRVQLVDGGVYDNQGIAGLLDPELLCSDFVISDASGQSDAADNPSTETFPVLINSSGVMGSRVREETVNSLELSRPDNVAYFHLKRGLFAKNIEFNKGGDTDIPEEMVKAGIVDSGAEFGVTQDAQRALAEIRTDLDSFTDVEAGCLQADGYQMSEPSLKAKLSKYESSETLSGNWQFSRYLPALKSGEQRVLKQLQLGRHQFLKPLFYVLSGVTSIGSSIKLALVSLPLIASLYVIFALINWVLKTQLDFDIWKIVTSISAFEAFIFNVAEYVYYFLALFLLSKAADFLIRGSGRWMKILQKVLKGPMSFITGIVVRAVLPVIFAIPIIIYIYTIDQYFIKQMGKLD